MSNAMKDWTGNGNSIFTTLGASNHTEQERERHDYYATDAIAIDKLASKFDIPHDVWECACGGGSLSERLKEFGHNVTSTDLIDRGYGQGGVDFLGCHDMSTYGTNCILTNPPYKYTTEFVLHALDLLPDGGYACFFLKTTALESKGRYEKIYKNYPPRYVFQCIERVLCAKNADFEYMRAHGGSAAAYAWFVWQKGWKGSTTIDWI